MNKSLDNIGAASPAWKAANRKYEVGSVFERLAEKGVQRSTGNNIVSPTEFLGGLGALASGAGGLGAMAGTIGTAAVRRHGSGVLGWASRALRETLENPAINVANKTSEIIAKARSAAIAGSVDNLSRNASSSPEKVATLAALERATAATQNKMESLSSTLVRGGLKASNVSRDEVVPGFSRSAGKSPDEAHSSALKSIEQVRDLTSSPQRMQLALTNMADGIHEHAPNVSAAMQDTAVRAAMRLRSLLPPMDTSPLAGKQHYDAATVAELQGHLDVIEHPLSIIKMAAAGTLTPDLVEDVRQVYGGNSGLFAKIQREIGRQIAIHGTDIPHQSREMISMIMGGADLDGSQGFGFRSRLQSIYSGPSFKQDGQGGAMPSRPAQAGKMHQSQAMMTPAQKAAAGGKS